jgi:hypothetical protein
MKKIIGLALMLCLLSAAVFAGDGEGKREDKKERKHEPFDMLLGINWGLGGMVTGHILNMEEGAAIFAVDIGLSYDFYVFSWLSVSSGAIFHSQVSAIWKDSFNSDPDLEFTDILQTPLCVTIPIQVHVNVPRVEWLYAGAGVNINIPVASLLSRAANQSGLDIPDTRGPTFISLPIDLGFDMIKPGKGGGRFFFRVTPTFLEGGTLFPVGFMWQLYNFRIFHRK